MVSHRSGGRSLAGKPTGIMKNSQDRVRSILDCGELVGSKEATKKRMEDGRMDGGGWMDGEGRMDG